VSVRLGSDLAKLFGQYWLYVMVGRIGIFFELALQGKSLVPVSAIKQKSPAHHIDNVFAWIPCTNSDLLRAGPNDCGPADCADGGAGQQRGEGHTAAAAAEEQGGEGGPPQSDEVGAKGENIRL